MEERSAVVALFDSNRRSVAPGVQPARVLPAQQAGQAGNTWYRIPLNEIVFAFLGSKTTTDLIQTKWARQIAFDEAAVYVRTVKGVFRTRSSHLGRLEQDLRDFEVVGVNRSLIARLDRVRLLNGPSEVGMEVANTVELLHAAHRDFNSILTLSGLSRRDFK